MSDTNGREIDIENLDYRLKSVALDDLHVTTSDFVFPHPKKVQLSFSVGEAEEYPLMRLSTLKVELGNSDEDVVATIEACFKVTFVSALKGDDLEALDPELNRVTTRVSYPYHRQLISDIVTRMGLRPTFLPIVHDDMWLSREEAEEAAEAEEPVTAR